MVNAAVKLLSFLDYIHFNSVFLKNAYLWLCLGLVSTLLRHFRDPYAKTFGNVDQPV